MHSEDDIILATKRWLSDIVIGMQLCPFAKQPYTADTIRYVVSMSADEKELLASLLCELNKLSTDTSLETTLLIHPNVLQDFHHYNQFLDAVDLLLEQENYLGIFQIASFHPQYQFAGTTHDAVENYTNRSPYPMLHILRETSLDNAIDAFGDTSQIPLRNEITLHELGIDKMRELLNKCSQ